MQSNQEGSEGAVHLPKTILVVCIICKELCLHLPLLPPFILRHSSLLVCHLMLYLCHDVNEAIPQSTEVNDSELEAEGDLQSSVKLGCATEEQIGIYHD